MQTSLRWRLGFIVAFAMMILALYPQLVLWQERGTNWSGVYAFFDTDEVAYSAYLQALIDGRPRRNDPYTGRDDRADAPQGESIFSIQVVPAYALATLARTFNLSSSTIFILLIAAAGAASALSIFWLIAQVTGDDRVAAVGALIALCLGTLANGQGAASIYTIYKAAYIYLPFLRRYVPSFSFPIYFVMCALVWRSLTSTQKRASLLSIALAAVCFTLLVFSYFYLWTTAAAWVACLLLLWIVAKPEGWRDKLRHFAIFAGAGLLSLIPFFVLISRRAATMDDVQALTFSRAPDLFQPPEIVGLLTLALLFIGTRRKLFDWRDKRVLFVASFALVPFVVFNQQIVTNRVLQPVHYEEFIANYVALVALSMAAALLWQGRARDGNKRPSSRILVWTAFAVCGWGMIETQLATALFMQFNLPRENIWRAAVRLGDMERERARQTPAGEGYAVALTPDLLQADTLPTAGPQAVLWAAHLHVFSGVTPEEDKERFYQHLYYTGVDEQEFRATLASKNFYYLLAIYGWERANPVLALRPNPITEKEHDEETRLYGEYVASFDRARAARPLLSYLVVAADETETLSDLDRWYERDEGERVGDFVIYRLRLKP